MCLNIGTLNNHHFPFGTNGKVVVLSVPILKHFRVVEVFNVFAICSILVSITSKHHLRGSVKQLAQVMSDR